MLSIETYLAIMYKQLMTGKVLWLNEKGDDNSHPFKKP